MIYQSFKKKQKQLALLIDPDKHSEDTLLKLSCTAQQEAVDFIFVGGSLVTNSVEHTVAKIKEAYTGPVV